MTTCDNPSSAKYRTRVLANRCRCDGCKAKNAEASRNWRRRVGMVKSSKAPATGWKPDLDPYDMPPTLEQWHELND